MGQAHFPVPDRTDSVGILWQFTPMQIAPLFDRTLHRRLVDGLYVEAMVMADEARAYFDRDAALGDVLQDPIRRVAFACESLKVTTRLMHVIAWLLSQRAWQRGEIADTDLLDEKYRLGRAANTDRDLIAAFPFTARAMIEGSQELYDRVARLQDRIDIAIGRVELDDIGPARALLDRLSRAF